VAKTRLLTYVLLRDIVAVHLAALHDEGDIFEDSNVFERITADGNDVGLVAFLKDAHFVGLAE
jgi:hypothetical protein